MNPDSETNPITCGACGKTFKTLEAFNKHSCNSRLLELFKEEILGEETILGGDPKDDENE